MVGGGSLGRLSALEACHRALTGSDERTRAKDALACSDHGWNLQAAR